MLAKAHGGFSVFAGVGERTREGNNLYREMIESGVIKLGDKQSESNCALVYGQMNEPPGARAHVGLTGLTVAEHFLRCQKGTMCSCSLITSSVSLRLILRCLLCLVVSHLLWVINLLSLLILEVFKSVSLPPRRGLLRLYRLFMCLLMI